MDSSAYQINMLENPLFAKPGSSDLGISLYNNKQPTNLNKFYNPVKITPFVTDFRESSYYIPVPVQDELLKVMNRERGSQMLNIFSVAMLTASVMSQYVQIEQKIAIQDESVLKLGAFLPVLKILWAESPKTPTEMYNATEIHSVMTLNQLLQMLNELVEMKLIKQKFIENSETQYFPALNIVQMIEKTEQLNAADQKYAEILNQLYTIRANITQTSSKIPGNE